MIIKREDVEDWIIVYIANILSIEKSSISKKSTFQFLGLDSTTVIAMTGDIEDYFNVPIDPTLIYDYPTIEKFAEQYSLLAKK